MTKFARCGIATLALALTFGNTLAQQAQPAAVTPPPQALPVKVEPGKPLHQLVCTAPTSAPVDVTANYGDSRPCPSGWKFSATCQGAGYFPKVEAKCTGQQAAAPPATVQVK